MLGIRFELMTINDSVMKVLEECATAQRAPAPLNENGSRINRNNFVTFRDAAFKPQNFWESCSWVATSALVRFTQAVHPDSSFAKRLLKYVTAQYAYCLKKWHSAKVTCDNVDKDSKSRQLCKKYASPENTLLEVSVGDRIESYIVCISKTVKDLNLCIMENVFYSMQQWWFLCGF